jgi:glucose/arabinose dehydrogenase
MPPFIGTDGNNGRCGHGADDTMFGRGGNDQLSGGTGTDTLYGEDGNDSLRGGEGGDLLDGGAGNDVIYGHADFDLAPESYWRGATSGRIDATRVGVQFDSPSAARAAPGDAEHLFVAELRTGDIRILDLASRQIAATPFLDLDDARLGQSGEQGFLGLAFDPDYVENGFVYVSIVDADGNTELLRFTRSASDPLQLDPASEQLIWEYPRNQPYTNHTGGWIEFGPDGYLYLASGDGGPGGDPNNVAQNTSSLLGKIHRIDVHGGDDFPGDPSRNYAIPPDNPFATGGGAPEVWAYGLRHPWRPGFDSLTGDLYIADVGQSRFEEINFQPAGVGGRNYGWSVLEGFEEYHPDRPGNPPPDDPSLVLPVLAYGRDVGVSITGGYVYRGPQAGLEGFYLYADFGSALLGTLRMRDGVAVDQATLNDRIVANVGAVQRVVAFAEDLQHNLYTVALSGQIYRLDPRAGAGDGDDELHGGAGDDTLYGGPGADQLYGDGDQDRLSGGFGADMLAGGSGDDVLLGDAGDDRAIGGPGNDDFRGGAGADTLVFRPGNGRDRFLDFDNATDRVSLVAFGFADVDEALSHARDIASNGNVSFVFDGGEQLIVANTTMAELADLLIV